MNNELVISSTPDEVNIALLEDKHIVELNSEKKDQRFQVGDIYLGRVKKLIQGLNAALQQNTLCTVILRIAGVPPSECSGAGPVCGLSVISRLDCRSRSREEVSSARAHETN